MHYWATSHLSSSFPIISHSLQNTQMNTFICVFFSFPLKFQFKVLLNAPLPISLKSAPHQSVSFWLSQHSHFSTQFCVLFLPHSQPSNERGWFHLPLSLLSQTSKSVVTRLTCLLTGDIIRSSVVNNRIAVPELNWGEQALCHMILKKNHPSLH